MPILDAPYDAAAVDAPTGAGFQLLPEGSYDLIIESFDLRPPKDATKYAQIMIKAKVVSSDTGQGVGCSVTDYWSLSPKASKMFIQRLDAMGIAHESLSTPAGPVTRFNTDYLPNGRYRARCYHQEQSQGKYAGQKRANWVSFEPSKFGAAPGQVAAPAGALPATPVASVGAAPPIAQPVQQVVAPANVQPPQAPTV